MQSLGLGNVGGGTVRLETRKDGILEGRAGANTAGISAVRGGGHDQLDVNYGYQDKEKQHTGRGTPSLGRDSRRGKVTRSRMEESPTRSWSKGRKKLEEVPI